MMYTGPGSPSAPQSVRAAAPGCKAQGCQFSKAAGLLDAARRILEDMRREHMSQALWCDAGGHAFSERDPGRQRISITVLDDETQDERAESRDFCGECAEKAGLLSKRRTRPAAAAPITAEPHRADPVKIRELEDELDMPHSNIGSQP